MRKAAVMAMAGMIIQLKKEGSMRNVKKVMVIALSFVSLFVCCNLHAAETDSALAETFGKHTEDIYEGLDDLYELIGKSLKDGETEISDLSKAIKKIEKNAASLVALGKKNNKEWQYEAQMIAEDVDDLKAELEGNEFDEFISVLSRVGPSLKTMAMFFPRHLLGKMEEHFGELEKEASKSDANWDDLEYTVEKLIIYSRQMGIAADAFGKKIWKKFTRQVWEICRSLDDAVEDDDGAKVKSLLKEADKPMAILKKLVK